MTARIALPTRRFAHWNGAGWQVEPGTYTLRIGASVAALNLELDWNINA